MATTQRITAVRLRELLALKRVVDDVQLIGDTENKVPFIYYRKADARAHASASSYVSAAWVVVSPGYRTDPDGSYRDGFNKTFILPMKSTTIMRNARLRDAQAWVTERYGVDDWVKTPFGGWTSRKHLDARLRELLPREFDPDYRDPIVQQIVKKLYDDETPSTTQGMYRVVVQLYVQPEPPLYVMATDADAARRQVTQLFTRLAGTRVLDGLKLSVFDA